jgi:hypothetical protein
MMKRFQTLLSTSTYGATARMTSGKKSVFGIFKKHGAGLFRYKAAAAAVQSAAAAGVTAAAAAAANATVGWCRFTRWNLC